MAALCRPSPDSVGNTTTLEEGVETWTAESGDHFISAQPIVNSGDYTLNILYTTLRTA